MMLETIDLRTQRKQSPPELDRELAEAAAARGPRPARTTAVVGVIRQRRVPLALGLAIVVSGMAFSMWWPWPTVWGPGGSYWSVPTDIWGTFRNAQYVSWGALPFIYHSHGYGLVGLPGMAILLAPVAFLADHLGMVGSAPWVPMFLRHPDVWLILGPCVLGANTTLLLVCDYVLERAGITRVRRHVAAVILAALSWPVTAFWGHPEDILALAGALLATAWVAERRHLVAAGWLIGAAICVQPLAVLVVPIWIGVLGWRRAAPLLLRGSLLPIGLLAVVFTVNPKDTWSALAHQANFPKINHATPWVYLAPKLSKVAVGTGPFRLATILLALLLGVVGGRFMRGDLLGVVWLCALAFFIRCALEPVMCPYYVMPVAMLGLVAVMRTRKRWLLVPVFFAGFLTVVTHFHSGPWIWYGEMMVGAVGLLGWRLKDMGLEVHAHSTWPSAQALERPLAGACHAAAAADTGLAQ